MKYAFFASLDEINGIFIPKLLNILYVPLVPNQLTVMTIQAGDRIPVPQDFMFLSLTFTDKSIKYSKWCRQLAY